MPRYRNWLSNVGKPTMPDSTGAGFAALGGAVTKAGGEATALMAWQAGSERRG